MPFSGVFCFLFFFWLPVFAARGLALRPRFFASWFSVAVSGCIPIGDTMMRVLFSFVFLQLYLLPRPRRRSCRFRASTFRKGSCPSAHRRPCRYRPRALRTTTYRRNLTTMRVKVLARRSGPIWLWQVVLPLALANVAASENLVATLDGKGASSRQARERTSRRKCCVVIKRAQVGRTSGTFVVSPAM